jgi:putative transcriptional regulator
MVRHHVPERLLVEYASGAQCESVAVLVATHLALCPICRARVAAFEQLGGEAMASLEPEQVSAALRARVMDNLDRPQSRQAADTTAPAGDAMVPQPLRGYLPGTLDRLDWRRRGLGIDTFSLDLPGAQERMQLLRLAPGSAVPSHSHHGPEHTIALVGGYSDEFGHYLRGDVAVADRQVTHHPVADSDGPCVCLVVTGSEVRFTGWTGRILNRLVRQ